jgi:CheY-like chemotaxis protein
VNVLLIEDNEMHAAGLAAWLQAHGHEVYRAGSAEEAMVHLGRSPADAIVLDHYLEGRETGLDFLESLRTLEESEGREPAPAVFATAAGAEMVERLSAVCELLGPVELLRKPYQPEDVLAALLRLTGEGT